MDATESRDAHEIITERHRSGSMILTSNRGPDEWLAMFADPMRAQSAIDRLRRRMAAEPPSILRRLNAINFLSPAPARS